MKIPSKLKPLIPIIGIYLTDKDPEGLKDNFIFYTSAFVQAVSILLPLYLFLR